MRRKTFKRLTATLLALLMVVTVVTVGFPLTASAAEAVTYTWYSWRSDGYLYSTVMTATDYTVVTSDLFKKNPRGLMSGTYVVKADTTIEDYFYIKKNQNVKLIVQPDVTLTCKKGIGCGYDKDHEFATLSIFGTGKIVATGKKYYAGIGGRDNESSGIIIVHGTTIEATGGAYGAGIGGGDEGPSPDNRTYIMVLAGNITAKGGKDAAGIGGGNEQAGARTIIYGGNITAEGNTYGAGIGGGDEQGTKGIWIYGGNVTAKGGTYGAGIGVGDEGEDLGKAEDGGGINILGGNVTAKGGFRAAGIGGGCNRNIAGTIDIKGEDTVVYAIAGEEGAGIGSGSVGLWFGYGDMEATITIDCGKNSSINAYGIDKEFMEQHPDNYINP